MAQAGKRKLADIRSRTLAPTASLPAGVEFVPLDADETTVPADFYLRVGGAATALLRGDRAPAPTLPVSPSPDR